jgi:hypothetical protein
MVVIRFVREVLTEHTDHPILGSFFLLAALFYAVALVSDPFIGSIPAGFMGVYALMWAFIAAVGYIVLYFTQIVSRLRRILGASRSDHTG